jgi:hypothetical protein
MLPFAPEAPYRSGLQIGGFSMLIAGFLAGQHGGC